MTETTTLVGEKGRPYLRTPPDFGAGGLPWGAYCKCAECGYIGRSTGNFDYYNVDGVLVCGACHVHTPKHVDAHMCALIDAGEFECDDLGPGCDGGYSEALG